MDCAISSPAAAAAALVAALGLAVAPAGAQPGLVNEDFDCYRPGDLVSTLPGWGEIGREAVISDEQAFSGANSLHLFSVGSDAFHHVGPFDRERVSYSVMTYVPESSVGLRGLVQPWAEFGSSPPRFVAGHRVAFDAATGLLELYPSPVRAPSTALILDRWVELRAEIDLAAGTAEMYYDGVWWASTDWPRLGDVVISLPRFEAITFGVAQLAPGPGMYFDDVIATRSGVTPVSTCGRACYADCDRSGDLTFFDFLCFQNHFAAADPLADCDGDGGLDFFDLLCFQNAFAAGCP